MGRTLLAAVTAPKELWVAPEADHNDLGMFGAMEAAVAFVRRHDRGVRGPASRSEATATPGERRFRLPRL